MQLLTGGPLWTQQPSRSPFLFSLAMENVCSQVGKDGMSVMETGKLTLESSSVSYSGAHVS